MARVVLTRSLGMIALGIWLILQGLAGFLTIAIPPIVMATLAIVAGVLILIGR